MNMNALKMERMDRASLSLRNNSSRDLEITSGTDFITTGPKCCYIFPPETNPSNYGTRGEQGALDKIAREKAETQNNSSADISIIGHE